MKISIFFVILFFIELSVIISQNQLCASENALLYFDKLFLSTWGENGNHYASLYLESGQYILSIEGNTILDSVIRAICGKFPDISVYQETVNQGCKHPYFMVFCEDFNQNKLMRNNYLQTFVISVIYQYKPLPETSYINSNIAIPSSSF